MVVGAVDLIARYCFAARIQVWVKHLSGKRNNPGVG